MSDNLVLGRGIVYLNNFDSGGNLLGERDVGNCPEFSFSTDINKLEHYNSRSGLKSKDKEVITQITPKIKFVLDELTIENFNMAILGTSHSVTQTAGNVTAEVVTAKLGFRVDLANRAVSSVVVKSSDEITTYVENTDYEIDTTKKDDVIGRINFLSGGSITDNEELHIDYDYADATYTKVYAMDQAKFESQVRFISDNPVGPQIEFTAWKVSITPDGDTAMIGDDWSTLSFTGEVLKDETNHSINPYFEVIRLSS